MDNSVLNIYLNTTQKELLPPHGFLLKYKNKIITEINPMIKKNFATSAKNYFYFSMKMQKLLENGSYNFSDTQIKSVPSHINPQDQNVHENIIDCAIEDLNEKWVNAPVEGSGWVLHSLTEGIVVIVATHKCMIPINSGSVGTWCPLPKGHKKL